MSLYQGSSIVTSGLAFYYDMNNKKSYVGPPSTNDVVAVTWSGDGGNQSQFAAGSTLVTDYNLKYRGLETYLWAPASSLNCYLNGGDFGASTSTTWTFSCYIRREDGQPISSLLVYLYTTTSDAAAGTITDVGGGWYRVHRTKIGTASAVTLAGFTGFASNVKYYLSGAMLTKTDYPVYPLNPLETRANTQAVLDLTNKNTITAASLTYNPNDTFSFNGATNYLSIAMTPTLQFQTFLTMDAWVRPTGTYSGDIIVLGQGAYYLVVNSDYSFGTYWYGKSLEGYHNTSAGSLTNNQWNNIVAVWGGSNLKLYVNGNLLNTITTTGLGSLANTQTWIGAEFNGTTRRFSGNIGSVKLYNTELTAAQILQNFNAHRGRYGI